MGAAGAHGPGARARALRPCPRQGRALDAEVLEIEADPNAEGFYRRMGARRVGEIVYELDGRERVLPLLAVEVRSPRTT